MTMLDTTAACLGADARAIVLLKSRRRLDLLNPDPQAWTDVDLAAGLSRTMRWGGASQWAHPLSVARHSLTVLAIREAEGPLCGRRPRPLTSRSPNRQNLTSADAATSDLVQSATAAPETP